MEPFKGIVVPCHELHPQCMSRHMIPISSLEILSVSSLGKTSQGPELLQISALSICFAAFSLGEGEQICTQQGKRMDVSQPNPWAQSCHIIWDAQWLSCWQLLPSNGPGDGSSSEVAHGQLVLGGVRLWIGIIPPKSRSCWLQRASKGSCNVEKTSSGALRQIVLSQKPRWKTQRSLWAQKRIKWIYWVQRKARQKQGKKYTVFISSAHCYSREKKYELQWTGKGFFLKVWKEKKYILFMLILCCQIRQPGKEIAIQISIYWKKRKLEQWGDYFSHRLVLEKQFFQVALSVVIFWYLGKGWLYHGHVIQEPPNCPNPDFSCSVACANGCNLSSFSVPLITSVFLENQ